MRRKEISNHIKARRKKIQMTTNSEESIYLQIMTLIDPAIGWIEICAFLATWLDLIVNLVGLTT